MREILAVLLIVTGLSACTDTAPRGGGDILVLGDSIMAWNGGRSIPDVIANQTGRSVTSRDVPGAQFDNGSTIASAVGFDIQQQFPGGRWNWVVVNGGANDLSADCGCGACGASALQGSVERVVGAARACRRSGGVARARRRRCD